LEKPLNEQITVCIPTHNAAATLKVALEKLQLQRIPNLKVLIYDNGSRDGTAGMLGEVTATNFYQMKPALDKYGIDITFLVGTHNDKMSPYQNGLDTRHKLARLVTTEYIFFLDPDVLLTPNSIPQALEDFKKETDCGFMTIRYEPDAGHVMLGATIFKTEVFRKIKDWDGQNGCDCNHCAREVEKMGLKAKQHPTLMAYHYKYF
jgi:cellulose synthase/poly-beta-1,6-N-acetylglucosamine synthase-like glycosyltransferase